MNARYWTPDADAAILTREQPDTQLSRALGRSLAAIRQRRSRIRNGRGMRMDQTGRPANRPEDLWRYVSIGDPAECWPWQGATRRRGYGLFTLDQRSVVAHRVAFELATGISPGDLFVCHRCDNPPCCNPAHLFLGTHADNMRDMVAKGRDRWRRQRDL